MAFAGKNKQARSRDSGLLKRQSAQGNVQSDARGGTGQHDTPRQCELGGVRNPALVVLKELADIPLLVAEAGQ